MFFSLSSALFSFFVASAVCVIASAAGAKKWDWLSEEYGVDKWAQNFPLNCNGRHQSPIDIKYAKYHSGLGEIEFTNYDTVPSDAVLTAQNDGHSYKVSFTGLTNTTSPKISGGGLPGEFEIAQFHFHWGSNNSQGSEHLLNGMAYQAELHLVHLNTKYSSDTFDHVSNADGLAVLGVFIKQGEHNDNFDFLNLTEHNVTYEGMASNFSLMNAFMNFLPSNKSFYRYNGSLTTPECHEVVTWTVFAEHVEISEAQLNALRDMMHVNFKNQTERLVNNYRPPQPLNGRMVLANFEVPLHTPTTSGNTTTPTSGNTTANSTEAMPSTSTTDGASRISQNYAMFVASFCLVVLSFLKT